MATQRASEAGSTRERAADPSPTSDRPLVSLIVSTVGRPLELRRLIDSICAEVANGSRIELIVVDQSHDTVSRSVLADASLPFDVQVTTSDRGVSLGRNTGLALATGDIVMFPDDDAWFEGTTLVEAVDYLEAHPDVAGFCARLCDGHGNNSMLRWAGRECWVSPANHHRTSIGSTMVFRRGAVTSVGGYDEQLGPGAGTWLGSCEDADLLLRILATGARVRYSPSAVVNHRDSRMDHGVGAASKALHYGCGQGDMWRRHRFSPLLVWGLLLRRLLGSLVLSASGRGEVARVRRAWLRGALNGLMGNPPTDLTAGGPGPEASNGPASTGPTGSEFIRSFSWRVGASVMGIIATFLLTAIAARELAASDLAVFYALLVALTIGPVLGRLGVNTRAVQELGAARGRGEIERAAEVTWNAARTCFVSSMVTAPIIALTVVVWSTGNDSLVTACLTFVILLTESIRLTASDLLVGLGRPGWAALLAHQARAVAVLIAVVGDLLLLGPDLTINRVLWLMAAVNVVLAAAGQLRLATTLPRASPDAGRRRPPLLWRAAQASLPFLLVDVVAIAIARGDVVVATKALGHEDGTIYSTASILAMQIGTPIGLANIALAPIVAGFMAQRRHHDLERLVRGFVTAAAALLLPVLVIAIVAGDRFLTLAYGDRFAASHPYFVTLLIGNIGLVVLGMSSVVLVMSGRQRLAMGLAVTWLGIVAPFAVGAAVLGGPQALAVASAAGTIGLYALLASGVWTTTGIRVYPSIPIAVAWARTLPDAAKHLHRARAPRRSLPVSPARPARSGALWWTSPIAVVSLIAIPALGAAYLISETTYIDAWRTPKSLDASAASLMMMGLLIFLGGVLVANLASPRTRNEHRWGRLSTSTQTVLLRTFPWLFRGTLFGYAAWFANGVLRHGLRLADITQLIVSQDNRDLVIKEKLPTIAGISTMTQLGLAVVVVGVTLDLATPRPWIRRAYRIVIALAVVRAFLLAERLAVLELVVPLVVLRATGMAMRRPHRRVALAWAPAAAVVLLIGGFAASEYSRSWNFYAEERDQAFVDFATERLVGYYATAYNNGALILEHGSRRDTAPYDTVAFVWEAPLDPVSLTGTGASGADIVKQAESTKRRILREYANPEFNSPSGVAAPFVDYGGVGGAAFFLLAGLVVGGLHLSFSRGHLWGLLVYPVLFTGLLEVPRYLYWAQGRVTPALVVLSGVVIAASHRASSELRRRHRLEDRLGTGRHPHPASAHR